MQQTGGYLPPVTAARRSSSTSRSSHGGMSPRRKHSGSSFSEKPMVREWDSRTTVPAKRSRKKSVILNDTPLKETPGEPHAFSFHCSCSACRFAERNSPELTFQNIRQRTTSRRKKVPFKAGDRVVLTQNRTGLIKWVGNIETGYRDDRIYVGVQLDEPVGESDGTYRSKRYFECRQNHGTMVVFEDVLYFMPKNGLRYRPLVPETKSSLSASQSTRRAPIDDTIDQRRAERQVVEEVPTAREARRLSRIEQKLLRAQQLGQQEQMNGEY